ncbi:MAG: repressor LexA [Phycisphaerae bacterium]|nr:repressor LexA [Phycisphaerae bacterium]HAW96624.1 repressor LexA [Phycisphaerales bacterium]
MTPKQVEIFRLIRDARMSQGFSPTLQELAAGLGVSRVTVHEHVEQLIKKGALTRETNKARSLSVAEDFVLPDEMHDGISFPLVGRIAAGYPIERLQDDESLNLESFFGPRTGSVGATFALQVEGESMQDEGIFDGDYVIVERRNTARSGERVVALLPEGESTLKTFFKEKDGRIRLQPANEAFDPIIVDDCQIQGVVIGVLRRY